MKPLLKQFARFTMVGGLATAFQYATLFVLVQSVGAAPVLASGAGYCGSAFLNYWLNHRYTFRSRQAHHVALPRFITVATCGLLINQLVFGVIIDALYFLAQVVATICVMAWNFTLGRLWTFGDRRRMEHGS